MTNRRHALATLGWGTAALSLAPAAWAQRDNTLKILVGFAAGGAADVVARAVGEGLRSAGYNALIDNRAGAAGRLATDALLAAPADGTTLLFTPSGNLTLYPHVYSKLRYQPRDFAPIGTACEFDFGLAVGNDSPVKNLKEFLARAKADPKEGAYGTPGAGTVMHFLGVMLGQRANVPLIQVPYKGGAAALTDVIGGAVPSVITTLPNLLPMHKAGKLRILAVSAANPIADLPGVPTFKSAGFADMVASEYFVLLARNGTPPDTVAKLSAALEAAVSSASFKAALEKLNFQPIVTRPEALAARLASEQAHWGGVVKASGYTPEA